MGIVVLDIGTSSMRGILYDDHGGKRYTRQISYLPVYRADGGVEQNPSTWENAMEEAVSACTVEANRCGEEIRAVSVTAQRSSVIPVGKDGVPSGKAMMWQDKRTLALMDEMRAHNHRIASLTGSPVNPVFSAPKMLWIRKNQPERYESAKHLAVIPEYLIYRMTGEWAIDATYASRSLLMNLRLRQWDDELLALFGVDRDKLSTIIEPGSIAGEVNREWAEKTGLKAGTPVVSAGGDQQCAALGMGVIAPGSMAVSAGTGAFILAACADVPQKLSGDVICNTSALPGAYLLESSIPSCASGFNWLLRLCYGMTEDNQKAVYDQVNREMELSRKKMEIPLVLPFFQGRGTPDWNSSARGCIHQLDLGTERGDLARALLEGIGCELALNMEVLWKYTGKRGAVHICGGLANSRIFCEILSGMCREKVCKYQDNEAAAIGAWIAAAVTTGLYPDYETAFLQGRKGHPAREIKTGEEGETYRNRKKQYQKLYQALYGAERRGR